MNPRPIPPAIGAAVVTLVAALLTVAAPDAARAAIPSTTLLVARQVTTTAADMTWQVADQHNPVIIGWQDETSPKGSSTWEGRYPAGTWRLNLTGLTPGHRYWIYVSLDCADCVGTSTTVTTEGAPAAAAAVRPAVAATPPTQAAPAGAPSPAIGRAASGRCVPRTLATRTYMTARREDTRRLRVSGYTAYWTVAGWQGAPPSDYRLTVQRRVGATWRGLTTITPGRATIISAPRGTYRLVFGGLCGQPVAPSTSGAVTR